MPTFVNNYSSLDLNAPPLTGQVGSLIEVCNQTLKNGYGWVISPPVSITRVGTLATVTLTAAQMLKVRTGMYLTISGCTGADGALYNGVFLVTYLSTTTFTYTMSGTPTGSAAGTISITSNLAMTLANVDDLVTATLTTPNPTLVTGDYVTITGAVETDFNSAYVVITVLSSTQFTYNASTSGTGSATGSPVYCKAGLQWNQAFAAGTNSQCYRSADSTSNQFYCQIIDNAATAGLGKEAQIYGAEVMSADNTVTSGRFPTAAQSASGWCVRKSATADTVTRQWEVHGDQRTFYIETHTGDTAAASHQGAGFGYFHTTKASDGYNTFCSGGTTFNVTTATVGHHAAAGWNLTGALAIARSYTQIGTCVLGGILSYSNTNAAVGVLGLSTTAGGVMTYPNGPDSGLYMQPLLVADTANMVRGRMPGYYGSLHGSIPLNHLEEVTGVAGAGNTLLATTVTNQSSMGMVFFDKFGPWT
jgi:hypothetical protein